jgi:hypothetical protein
VAKNSLFALNDDSVLERIISQRYSSTQHPVVSVMTQVLGNEILKLYSNFGNEVSWYGIFLYLVNFFIAISALRIAFMTGRRINLYLSIVFIILVVPFNVLTPTYTVTSVLSSGVGLLGIVVASKFSKEIFDWFIYSLLILLSFLIRPEALVGTLVFLGPTSLLFILIYRKIVSKKGLILTSVATLGFLGFFNYLQVTFLAKLSRIEPNLAEYLNFQAIRHEIFYTPAFLKLNQGVISGDILNGIWSKIDFIILRDWAYADSNVFSYFNILSGRNNVSKYIGFEGVLNSDFSQVFEVITNSISEVIPVLFIILFVAILIFYRNYLNISNNMLSFALVTSYAMGFFYAAAVLRLPFRVIFPYLALLILALILFEKVAMDFSLNRLFSKVVLFVIVIQLGYLQFNSYLGTIGINSLNMKRLEFAENRDRELAQAFQTATFIGPLAYFPISIQGSYFSNLNWQSGVNTVALDWSTFSPTWRAQVAKLNLDTNNLYNSLAKQENVYWVSNSYLAEILEMYMNDRQIYRGKLCSVANLSGSDQAEIFTYQAKETDC